MTRWILCFGDSLTWGWIATPEGAPTTRYPYSERWTGVMAAALGSGYEIIEEGLNARTTSIDDPVDPRLNGAAYLPTALASHLPLDLVILQSSQTHRVEAVALQSELRPLGIDVHVRSYIGSIYDSPAAEAPPLTSVTSLMDSTRTPPPP